MSEILNIATAPTAGSSKWKNEEVSWSDLVLRLKDVKTTDETYAQYIKFNKEEQLQVKDVGGFVGGYLINGKRKKNSVGGRSLLTLDIDFASTSFWEDFKFWFSVSAVLHSTHKHIPEQPRYRLIIPLDEEVAADKYEAIARKVAGELGIEYFDNTTFEPNRLMFWPSKSKDVEYYFKEQKGDFLCAQEVLDSYRDWTDTSLWPTSAKQLDTLRSRADKQQDPMLKRGIIGAFCRAHTITDVLTNILSDKYKPVDDSDDRWTYVDGSTSKGLIVYDDKFAYSHHGTDPSGGMLCNAFDFVRVHKFGHLDENSRTGSNHKSFKAMEDFAREDGGVKKLLTTERLELMKSEFEELDEELNMEQEDNDWMEELEMDKAGKPLSSAKNISLIFQNDIRLKDRFKYNEFDKKSYIWATMPWRKIEEPEPIRDVDLAGVRNYIDKLYNISSSGKIDDALLLELENKSFHPIIDYLKNLKWDGEKRIDSLLVDYFGAEDNAYTREAIRKTLVGAVGRVFRPGIKFDLVLTLVGDQGAGKSTFISKLGKNWYSDTFDTVHGKEAFEQIQGAWVIELAELNGLRKAEVESIKHFISKQSDKFRKAYGKVSETLKRQCVFIGTTNNRNFLRDPSGNRRFNPVDVNSKLATKSVFDDLDNEVDQIWAEAVMLFRKGEKLYLSDEAEVLAKAEQRDHSEEDERKGLIESYVDMLVPKDWESYSIPKRRSYIQDILEDPEDSIHPKGEYKRDYICTAEVWCECLGKPKEDMSRYNTQPINAILRQLPDWEQSKSTKHFGAGYGPQKYYSRIKNQ